MERFFWCFNGGVTEDMVSTNCHEDDSNSVYFLTYVHRGAAMISITARI
jgi:hypothetical protein